MRFLDRIDRSAIGALLDRDEYFWLDLDAPSNEDVDTLDSLFHFHPLALEDLRKKGQRPKLEDFGDYMFLVYYGAQDPEGGDGVALEEVHAFISGSYLVTVHDGDCSALDEVRKRLKSQPPSSEQFVVYRVLDALTDSFFPLLEDLEERLEQLDEEIFSAPSPDHLKPLTELRRALVELGRVATPQRDLLARHVDDILEVYVRFVDVFPTTASEKIKKFTLRETIEIELEGQGITEAPRLRQGSGSS